MPSPTNTATAGNRPAQPLGTVHQQTQGLGTTGEPAPQPHTPPDASARGHQPAAGLAGATHANLEPHQHHSPPIRPTKGPTHALSEGPPTQACTATLTDATSARPERPLGTVRPHAHNPTESPSTEAPATPSTSAPGCHPPAPAQAEPASQQHHNPPAGPVVRPTETPSGNRPAANLDPDPELNQTRATVPANSPRVKVQGRKLPTGVPHPEGRNRKPGLPRRRELAAHGHWQTTWEASLGRQLCRKAKPERRRNRQASQPRCPHRPPSHNTSRPRWTPRRKRGNPSNVQKRHRQRRTYPPGHHPERRYLARGRASQKASVPARRPIARRTWRQA